MKFINREKRTGALSPNQKDETINTDGLFTQSSQTIDKKFYALFKKDPDLSLKKVSRSSRLTAGRFARLK